MSGILVGNVYKYELPPGKEHLQEVLVCMAEHGDDDGSNVRPSVARLQWKLSCGRSKVQRAIAELRKLGVLVLVTPATAVAPAEYQIDLSALTPKQPFNDWKRTRDRYRGRQTPDSPCDECGVDTTLERDGEPAAGRWEWYRVHGEVWDQAGGERFLCIGCLEGRLGRRLRPADFTRHAINSAAHVRRNTARLNDRLGHVRGSVGDAPKQGETPLTGAASVLPVGAAPVIPQGQRGGCPTHQHSPEKPKASREKGKRVRGDEGLEGAATRRERGERDRRRPDPDPILSSPDPETAAKLGIPEFDEEPFGGGLPPVGSMP